MIGVCVRSTCEFLPVLASSSCVQTRARSPPRHPTICCEPETADYQCKGPVVEEQQTVMETEMCNSEELNFTLQRQQYLDILCQAVENLFSNRHGLREVPLAWFINDILPWVIPVEVTDRLLRPKKTRVRKTMRRGDHKAHLRVCIRDTPIRFWYRAWYCAWVHIFKCPNTSGALF